MHTRNYRRTRSRYIHGVYISDKKKDRLKQVETFKYLGSIISEKCHCEGKVRHRLGAGE